MKQTLLLPALALAFTLGACKESDDDLPRVQSSKLEGSTWVTRPYTQGGSNDEVEYHALIFSSPSRYTRTTLDAAGMPKTVKETGRFTILRDYDLFLIRLYPSDYAGDYSQELLFDEEEGKITDEVRVYRRRP